MERPWPADGQQIALMPNVHQWPTDEWLMHFHLATQEWPGAHPGDPVQAL